MLFRNLMHHSASQPRNEKGQFVAAEQELGIGARLAGLVFGRRMAADFQNSAVKSLDQSAGHNSEFERMLSDKLKGALKRAVAAITIAHIVDSTVGGIKQNIAHSQGVMGLSLSSGMGLGASQRAILTAQALGVDPSSVPGIGRNSWMSQMMASTHGIGGAPGSPEQLRQYRNRYNSLAGAGPMGLMMAQQMESSLGFEGYRPMTALSNSQFERQIARSETAQKAFALTPAEIRQTNNDLVMLGATWKEFTSLFRTRIAAELIPYVNAALDKGIGYMTDHADEMVAGIRGTIEGVVGISRWLYMYIPPLLDEGKRHVLDFITYIAEGTPQAFSVVSAHVDDLWNRVLFGAGQVASAWDEAHARFETKLKPAFFEFIDGIGKKIEPYLQLLSDPEKAKETLESTPTGRTILRSINIANDITGPIADTASDATKAFGAPEWVQSLAGWLAPPAVGMGALGLAKWGGKALLARIFGSGAAAAAASATGAAGTTATGGLSLGAAGATSLAAAPAAAIAATTLIGAGAGIGLGSTFYGIGQEFGLIDREQSFSDRMATGWGRFRDIVTLNSGHYDRMVNEQWEKEYRARLEEEAAANQPSAIKKLMAALRETSAPFAPSALGLAGGQVFSGISNAPGASSVGVLSRYAPQANSAAAALREWARNARADIGNSGTPEQRGREFDEWKRDIKRIANNSDKQTQSMDRLAMELGYNLIGRVDSYIAQEAANMITRGGVGV